MYTPSFTRPSSLEYNVRLSGENVTRLRLSLLLATVALRAGNDRATPFIIVVCVVLYVVVFFILLLLLSTNTIYELFYYIIVVFLFIYNI